MKAIDYWNLFLDTGAPECYLMFQKVRRTEGENVFEDTRPCAPANGVQ